MNYILFSSILFEGKKKKKVFAFITFLYLIRDKSNSPLVNSSSSVGYPCAKLVKESFGKNSIIYLKIYVLTQCTC